MDVTVNSKECKVVVSVDMDNRVNMAREDLVPIVIEMNMADLISVPIILGTRVLVDREVDMVIKVVGKVREDMVPIAIAIKVADSETRVDSVSRDMDRAIGAIKVAAIVTKVIGVIKETKVDGTGEAILASKVDTVSRDMDNKDMVNKVDTEVLVDLNPARVHMAIWITSAVNNMDKSDGVDHQVSIRVNTASKVVDGADHLVNKAPIAIGEADLRVAIKVGTANKAVGVHPAREVVPMNTQDRANQANPDNPCMEVAPIAIGRAVIKASNPVVSGDHLKRAHLLKKEKETNKSREIKTRTGIAKACPILHQLPAFQVSLVKVPTIRNRKAELRDLSQREARGLRIKRNSELGFFNQVN
jgi:hypothetical protein